MRPFSRFAICCLATLTLLAASDAQAGGIPAKTVKDLKAATVYIKVQFRDAIGPLPATGSGFVHHVDGENGYIVTNDHVVSPRFGQVRDGNPKLVFHSGTPNEKTVDAVIVASDPIRDLAVLKVTGLKDLPRPIPMDLDREATETMPVYSLGFPFGKKLALNKGNHPAINITRGTVTSLRTDSKGEVFLVQIDAEINPGNSGGPIVDDKGYLVGVAVSKFVEARTVGFAIPTKPLAEMMQGKVARLTLDPIQVDKAKTQISVAAGLLDPLGKLESLAIYYRPFAPSSEKKGEVPDLPRPDKDGKVPLLKGATMVALKVDGSNGVGTFSVERGQTDKLALIVQPSYVNGTGKKIIMPASITTILIPKVIYTDKLTRADAIDKARGQPSKRFTHKMQAGKHYVIEMRGDPREIDPWLILRDSAGNILAEDDDSGGWPNALIVYSPRKDDDYDISATVFKGDKLGPFTLRIREETGLEVGPKGLNKAGALSAIDPLDPFTTSPAQTFNLILKKGRPCMIDMKSKDFDPYLRLENMAGVNLKFEDIGGEGHSTLLFTPFVDGVYRVVASSYDYKTGAFDLKVTEGKAPEQYVIGPGGLKLAASLTKTDPLDVEFGRATQFRCKIYEVKLKAGQKYQFDLTTAQFEPVLRIEDARGKELAFDRNSGGQRNSRINFSPAADGVFRVIVSHFDGRLGTFNLDVRPLLPEKGAQDWFTQGQAHAKLGQWDQAIAGYTKAIEQAPTAHAAYNERGIAFYRKGMWDKAHVDFGIAIELNPKHPVYWSNRGDTFGQLGRWDEAIAALTKALDLDPKAEVALNLRGVAYSRQRQWDKAKADFTAAIELNPNIPIYWSNRGDIFTRLGQWDNAISDLSKSIGLNPGFATAWILRGSAHASVGQWEKASEDLAKAGSLPNALPAAWSNLALVRLQLEDPKGYRQACARLVEKWMDRQNPQLAVLIAWTGSVAPESGVDLGRLVQVLEKNEKNALKPDYPYLRALGSALYRSGKSAEAIKKLQEAVNIRKQPTPSVWIFLAMAHHQLGQKDDAQKWLEKTAVWLEEMQSKNSEAEAKAGVSWKNLPWTERLALEKTFREAKNLLKNPGKKDNPDPKEESPVKLRSKRLSKGGNAEPTPPFDRRALIRFARHEMIAGCPGE